MKMVLASRNRKKIAELQTLLGESFPDLELLSLDDVGFVGEIEETGETFEENALIKAQTACRVSGLPGIADDSGLAVDALNGAPGVYSARYAGGHGDDEANNAKLLSELENVPDEKRTASFICCMAVVWPNGKKVTVQGSVSGLILREKRGNGGFGYDPLFYYPPLEKTTAELSAEEKNAVSHRGSAVRELCRVLKDNKISG